MLSWLAVTAALTALAPQQELRVPLDSAWELSSGGARIEEHKGMRAIRMRTGRAIRRDVSLQDGTIEFDMAVTPRRSFVFVQFRIAEDAEYEDVYFRPHKSSLPDAIQYAPVWHGESNWQLYHGPGGTAPYTFAHGEWIHVRLVLEGRRAAIFVGDGDTPEMELRLARDPAPGYLAFSSFVPDGGATDGGEPAASFANVVVRPGHTPYRFPPPAADSVPAGLVTRWQLSPAFKTEPGPVIELPRALLTSRSRWPAFGAEPNGILVIGRHMAKPETQAGTVARLVLRAPAAALQPMQLGYSDHVTVFVNGRPLFAGDAHYSFDRPRQDGLIGLWQSTVWLPLVRGDNEVLLIVSDGFGGWGLTARLDPAGRARVVEP